MCLFLHTSRHCCPKDAGSFSMFLNPYRGFDRCATSENRSSWITLESKESKEEESIIFLCLCCSWMLPFMISFVSYQSCSYIGAVPATLRISQKAPHSLRPHSTQILLPWPKSDQYPINLLRRKRYTNLQHRNTPTLSIQIPVYFTCFGAP